MHSTRSFTPTRQSNPCLICSDIKGNRRQTPEDLHLWIVVAYLYCDRPSSSGYGSSPCDRPSLPQCKTPSLRRESAKRSAYLHPSQKPKRLTRSSRKTMRYRFGFLWGLWLPVAVQNVIRYSPKGMPSAERSFIASCPTQAAGAVA